MQQPFAYSQPVNFKCHINSFISALMVSPCSNSWQHPIQPYVKG